MKKILLLTGVISMLIFLASCERDNPTFSYHYYAPEDWAVLTKYLDIPNSTYDYDVNLPIHLGGPGVATRFIANNDRATLGRVLFYDKELSKDRSVSCASCHAQSLAFSDNKAFSDGVEGNKTTRNSQPLGSIVNFAAYYGTNMFGPGAVRFFWDERANTVMEQCRETFGNPNEMGLTMAQVVNRVKENEIYPILFKKAFNNNQINEDNVLDALGEFINSMGSFNSRYDKVFAQQPAGRRVQDNFTGFTELENQGKAIYQSNCAGCHGPNISRPAKLMAYNGIELTPQDMGKGSFTGKAQDMGMFKVHSLRNIALTGPYMHDGRFQTLDEVLDHYSQGIRSHANLDPLLRNANNTPKKFDFSDQEREALKAFLHTLTDDGFIADVKYSDPFKR
jgi:cytochrome c peroxidase